MSGAEIVGGAGLAAIGTSAFRNQWPFWAASSPGAGVRGAEIVWGAGRVAVLGGVLTRCGWERRRDRAVCWPGAPAGGLRLGRARSMNAAEYYDLLVGERGWTNDRFRAWLLDCWSRTLLAPG